MTRTPQAARAGPLRVAVLSPAAELGGAERSLLAFLELSADEAIEATVLLPRSGPLCDELTAAAVRWEVVAQPLALLRQSRDAALKGAARAIPLVATGPGYLWRLARAVARLRPHVLYTNGVKCHLLSAALKPLVRVPVVWHARLHWARRLLGAAADLAADLVIANSHATAAAVRRTMRSQGRIAVIHNAVDTAGFCPGGPAADLGATAHGGHAVGLVAALAPLKGHALLLEAARTVLCEFPSTTFFFIGGAIYDTDGHRDYEVHLHNRAAELGLTDRVVFTGFQNRMPPWYRAMDVVVNASVRPEGFGRTLLEAMACCRPAVGPRAGGIPEFVEHGRSGLLYPMGDAGALAEAILTLLRSPALRNDLGAEGRRAAVARFGTAAHAQAVAQALRRAARGETGEEPETTSARDALGSPT